MAEQPKRTATKTRKRSSSDDREAGTVSRPRAESQVIAAYLDVLVDADPRRGRKRTKESIDKRLAALEEKSSTANALTRLSLIQERMNLLAEKEALLNELDLSEYEEEFVSVAREYGERKKISYAAWREVGVPAPTLRRAGIGRSSQT